MRVGTGLLFLSFFFFFQHQVSSDAPPLTSRIAIVGGGASGVSAAWWLKSHGFQDVKIFEKTDALGGFARTYQVDGYYYDIATMFVPGGTVNGDGINPWQKQVIDFSEMTLSPAPDFDTLLTNETKPRLVPYAEVFFKYDRDTVVDQLVRAFTLTSELSACVATGKNCIECGICISFTESLIAFGKRKNLSAFVDLVLYIDDGLGAGPTAFGSAIGLLPSGFWWIPVEIHRSLRYLGYTSTNLPPNSPPGLVSLFKANQGQGSRRWWQFDQGYQTFWQKVAAKAKVAVALSEPVTSLSKENGEWKLVTPKGSYGYDIVIVSSPPQDTIPFLQVPEQNTYLNKGLPLVPPNDIFILRVPGFGSTGLPEKCAFWPINMGIGTTSLLLDGTPFFFQKRHQPDVMVVATYSLPNLTPDFVLGKVTKYLNDTLGLVVTEELHRTRVVFPTGPSTANTEEWGKTWKRLQGKDGLLLIGEAFSGSGVPSISTFLFGSFLPNFFLGPPAPTTPPTFTSPPTLPPSTLPPSPPPSPGPAPNPAPSPSPNGNGGGSNVININFSGLLNGLVSSR